MRAAEVGLLRLQGNRKFMLCSHNVGAVAFSAATTPYVYYIVFEFMVQCPQNAIYA